MGIPGESDIYANYFVHYLATGLHKRFTWD